MDDNWEHRWLRNRGEYRQDLLQSFHIALEAQGCITFFILRDCSVWTQGVNRSGQRARAQINQWRRRATLTFVALKSLVPQHKTVLTNTRQTMQCFLITLCKTIQQMSANDPIKSPMWGQHRISWFQGRLELHKERTCNEICCLVYYSITFLQATPTFDDVTKLRLMIDLATLFTPV